jgi:hypothetical protein
MKEMENRSAVVFIISVQILYMYTGSMCGHQKRTARACWRLGTRCNRTERIDLSPNSLTNNSDLLITSVSLSNSFFPRDQTLLLIKRYLKQLKTLILDSIWSLKDSVLEILHLFSDAFISIRMMTTSNAGISPSISRNLNFSKLSPPPTFNIAPRALDRPQCKVLISLGTIFSSSADVYFRVASNSYGILTDVSLVTLWTFIIPSLLPLFSILYTTIGLFLFCQKETII